MSKALLPSLTEAYYKESDELKELQSAMDEISAYLKKRSDEEDNPKISLSGSGLSRRLEASIEKLMNVERAYIDWHDVVEIDIASTYVNFVLEGLRAPEDVLAKYQTRESKSGIQYRDRKGKEFFFNLSPALLYKSDYDTRGVIAVLLHEIGHNFFFEQQYLNQVTGVLSPLTRMHISLIKFIQRKRSSGGKFWKVLFKSEPEKQERGRGQIKNKNVLLRMFYETIISGFTIAQSMSRFPFMIYRVARLIYNPESFYPGFKAEKFSDRFAANYGYGPDLTRYLSKIDETILLTKFERNSSTKPSNVQKHFTTTMIVAAYYVTSFVDPHPTTDSRLMDTMKHLERELSNSKTLSNNQKAKIKSDIADIKKQIKARESEKKKYPIYEAIQKLNKLFFGTTSPDWRDELFDKKDLEEAIKLQRVYNEGFTQFCNEIGLTSLSDYQKRSITFFEYVVSSIGIEEEVDIQPMISAFSRSVFDRSHRMLTENSIHDELYRDVVGQIEHLREEFWSEDDHTTLLTRSLIESSGIITGALNIEGYANVSCEYITRFTSMRMKSRSAVPETDFDQPEHRDPHSLIHRYCIEGLNLALAGVHLGSDSSRFSHDVMCAILEQMIPDFTRAINSYHGQPDRVTVYFQNNLERLREYKHEHEYHLFEDEQIQAYERIERIVSKIAKKI